MTQEFNLAARMEKEVRSEVLQELNLKSRDLDKAEEFLLKNPQNFNVVDSCHHGYYPLPSEKGHPPSITKEEVLRLMEIYMPIDHAVREKGRKLKA